jgi:hypothetical protein
MTTSKTNLADFKSANRSTLSQAQPFTDMEMRNVLKFVKALRGTIDDLLEKGYTISADGTMNPPINTDIDSRP